MGSARLSAGPRADAGCIDKDELRRVLGAFVTGVAVVTTLGDDGAPVGLTVNSFNSVSLDPPLVLWSLSLEAPSLGAFRNHDYFAVNILAAQQGRLCDQFAQPAEDKFSGVAFDPGVGGVPLIEGAVAQLECRTNARYPGGDHEVIIGEIVSLHGTDGDPLVLHQGRFKSLVPSVGSRSL